MALAVTPQMAATARLQKSQCNPLNQISSSVNRRASKDKRVMAHAPGSQVQASEASVKSNEWRTDSWKSKKALQLPKYPDPAQLESTTKLLETFPPLVFAGEARKLEERLGEAALGKAFLLQGGDCAESFKEFNANNIRDTFRVLLQMSAVLMFGGQVPVVKVGRMAGQFAKPRSEDFEVVNGIKVPSYRGDIVNGDGSDLESRQPDPDRMVRAYCQAAATLNLLRAFATGGYAAMQRVTQWNLDFTSHSEQGERYIELAHRVDEALGFMSSCGITVDHPIMSSTEFWTSHECLLLPFEQSMTREDSTSGNWYDCSAHMLWIGERTRQLDGAHLEFLRGVANPLGLKASDKMDPAELVKVCEILNPQNKPGRLTIIVRMGAEKLRVKLPHLIRAVRQAGLIVTWVSDPMHGNTIKAPSGSSLKLKLEDLDWFGTMENLLLLLIPCVFISINHCSEAATPNFEFPYSFMTADAEKAAARTYDYIVVGGGAAGCPLAATLSQYYSVLVLERGGSPYGNPDIENANFGPKILTETDNYTSIAQGFVSDDGVQLHRARVLGGGTAINGGFYSRASLEYIRNMKWNGRLVNESFEWVEKQNAFKPRRLDRWSSAVRDGLLGAGVFPYNGYTLDHVQGTKISASIFDSNEKRHTAADLLKNANPQNIVVLLNATAARILFNSAAGKPKACGVRFMSAIDGRSYTVSLNQLSDESEVILSAGSVGSPQLLLLSGIGPSEHLKQFNIPVILDLPSVGKDVQDNPGTSLTLESPIPLEFSTIKVVAILNNSQAYIEFWSNAEQVSIKRTSNFTRTRFWGGIFGKVSFPLSRGELRLHTRDPRDNPLVVYNYFSHPNDLQTCVQAMKVVAKLMETTSMQQFTFKNKSSGTREIRFIGIALPKNTSDNKAVAKFCQDALVTNWHFHGGCNIGSVIDQRYRVNGVHGLRIVDGSTFNDVPGTNPQATTMMLGRYVGLKIVRERLHLYMTETNNDEEWRINHTYAR